MRHTRYVLHRFVTMMILSSVALVTMMLVIDLADQANRLARHAKGLDVLRWLGACAAVHTYRILPLAAFFGVLVTAVILGRRGELLALELLGINRYKLRLNFAILGLILALFTFILGEIILPSAGQSLHNMRVDMLGRAPSRMHLNLTRPDQWFSIDSKLLYLPLGYGKNGFSHPMVFHVHNDLIDEVTTARHLIYNQQGWMLQDVRRQRQGLGVTHVASQPLGIDVGVLDLTDVTADPEVLSFFDLDQLIQRRTHAGLHTTAHRLHWQKRLANPALMMLLMALAAVWALRPERLRSLAQELAVGTVTLALLIAVGQSMQLLALAQDVPVFVGAWSMNLVCCALIPVALWLRGDLRPI